jgi:DNA-binding CsgD family transcriptional regulator
MHTDKHERARARIIHLTRQATDLVSLWQGVAEELHRVVPHFVSPCWFTMDPMSLLVTSHYQSEIPQLPVEWLAHEYFEDDFQKMADVARSQRGISTLHEATGGDPSRSAAWNLYLRPNGAEQEALVALRTRAGEAWGMLGLYREPRDPLFDTEELHFLGSVAAYLAEGAKRSLLFGEARDPEGPTSPGLIILGAGWQVESISSGVARWLDELPGGDWTAHGRLPDAVLAVAGRALRSAKYPDRAGEVALARVLSRTGQWVVLHGATLLSERTPRVAVIVEAAHPSHLASLLMAAYGLTEREQEITRLVLQGNSTAEIATGLVVSNHTVQQHLKSIFEKTGVRSRRELVGKVFFVHYEPRLRDNEARAETGQPLRGRPFMR